MSDELFVKRFILRKLVNLGKIGRFHTSLFNLSKGIPNYLCSNKNGQKIIKKAIKELISENILLLKQSTNEKHVFINPQKIKEVNVFLGLN